jgi:hypothetical protein
MNTRRFPPPWSAEQIPGGSAEAGIPAATAADLGHGHV